MEDDNRRDEMLMGLVYRARWDEQFRKKAYENPREALATYSYYLTEAEMEAVINFHSQLGEISDDELKNKLAAEADPISRDGA